jgi:hypothetical protein
VTVGAQRTVLTRPLYSLMMSYEKNCAVSSPTLLLLRSGDNEDDDGAYYLAGGAG